MENLTEILTQYANEDLSILTAEGSLAVTDTKVGVIWASFENEVFTLNYNDQKNMLQTPDKEVVIAFLIDNYKVG